MIVETELQTEKIEILKEWQLVDKISHAPTLLINSNELSKEYDVEDLKYLLFISRLFFVV
jgi:hypothetical protein